MLAHDTYDDLDHSSRTIVALVTIVPTLLLITLATRALVRESRGSENAFCIAIREALPSSTSMFVMAAVAASTLLSCAMEAGDAIGAGQPIDDLDDLFGGSVVFGGTIVGVTAVMLALMTLSSLRRLSRLRLFAGIVGAFLRRNVAPLVEGRTDLEVAHQLIYHACDICHRVAGRAPPRLICEITA